VSDGAILGLLAGLALGLVYFGGLWWTVRRVPTWRRPERALLASFVARALLALPAFAALALHGPVPLVAALVGFLVARAALQASTARCGGAP
jgi:F1F0 ATPase subunit 2